MLQRFVILIIFSFFAAAGCRVKQQPNDWRCVAEFDNRWKFSIGDELKWAESDFNDSEWETIEVPSPWENEGYHGYDGYAWYRNSIVIPENLKEKPLYLSIGTVDDVDEVYFNGNLIGYTGKFPPKFETAYTAIRKYPIPPDMINYGRKNTIAVRIYDVQLEGGITGGETGVFIMENSIEPEILLSGQWDFKPGDSSQWKETETADSGWTKIIVPGFWESQGFYDYDGYGWYRKQFEVPAALASEKQVLLMGKIDDFDEVYINGQLVGSTGDLSRRPRFEELTQYYLMQRNYFLPAGVIKPGKNTLAVRVYDGFRDGGIYEGPIGLISQKKYTEYWKKQH